MIDKIVSKTAFKVFNWIFVIGIILLFEFGICNLDFTKSVLKHENLATFHFSLLHLIVYIIMIIAVIFINKSRLIEEIKQNYQFKSKKIMTILYIALAIIILVYYGWKCLRTDSVNLSQFIRIILLMWTGLMTVIYISKNYITNIIVIGLMSSIFANTVTVYHIFDEKRHFMSAYNLSYGNINFQEPILDKTFMNTIPRGAHYTVLDSFFKTPYEYEEGFLEDEADSTPAPYNPIFYIPSALGILIARLLRGSVADVFLLGRIFNLMAYLALAIMTIKILPFKKNLFYVILLIPIFLCYSATYSIDGLGIGVISLFIAYCLKLYNSKPEEITLKKVATLLLLFAFVLIYKSMSAILLATIFLILPIKTIFKQNKKKIFLVLIGIIILFIALLKLQQPVSIQDNRFEGVDSTEQIRNIITTPQNAIIALKNHIKNTIFNYAWLKDFNPELFVNTIGNSVFMVMMFYYFYIAIRDDSKNFSFKEKMILLGAFALVYLSNSLLFYIACTPVRAHMILGYQVRYIFPFVSLILMCCSTKNLKSQKQEDEVIKITCLPIIFIIIGIIGAIMK